MDNMQLASQPPPRPVPGSLRTAHMGELLESLIEAGGSDLHIKVGAPPSIRVLGEISALPNRHPLTSQEAEWLVASIMSERQRASFASFPELDFAYEIKGLSRFRVNVHRERGHAGAAIRAIPWTAPALSELGLPSVIARFAELRTGLVLVTGPTGSGKSTTLAGLVRLANATRSAHIITVEDPIEFVHDHQRSLVMQREVGIDTPSFSEALKHALRQDPDIILVGEMRDQETISMALSAAETGHLVLATLHTSSAVETITRIVDVFPEFSKEMVRLQLSSSLQAVVCQTLCPTGSGQVPACEIMLGTPNVRNMIRENRLAQVASALQTGGATGMVTLNQSLAGLVRSGRIPLASALAKSDDQHGLAVLLKFASVEQMRKEGHHHDPWDPATMNQ